MVSGQALNYQSTVAAPPLRAPLPIKRSRESTPGNGPASGDHIPIVMVLIVADNAKGEYSGATILPNGARAPHLETTVVNGEMRWKQENSGGGFWLYAGRIVSRDSIGGTVVTDWPQLPAGEKPPAGTFGLVRQPRGK